MTDFTPQQRVVKALQAVNDVVAQRQQKLDVLGQLSAAGDPERDIRSQITALEKSEADAMDKWAAAGAKGDQPTLDHAKREALSRQLVESQAQAQAAQRAAQKIQAEVEEFHGKCSEASATHKIESLAYLASFADDLGEAYRSALIEVERSRAMLLALGRLLADSQTLDDQRTTAFLPKVQPHINLHDFHVEKVQAGAMAEANEHWQQLWKQCMRGSFAS